MKVLKQYWLVILIVIIMVTAVLLRTLNSSNFKYDAGRLAGPSVMRSNIITADQVAHMPGEKLIIDLDSSDPIVENSRDIVFEISPDSILSRSILKVIRGCKGAVVLACPDYSISARLWMVLRQMGIRNLYILAGNENPEALSNKFRPDSLAVGDQ